MVFLINIWYTVKGKLGDVHADIGGQVRLHRHYLLLLRQHPGFDDGPAGCAAYHAISTTGWWPTPTSASWGRRGDGAGGLYFILPRITGKPLHSTFLADLQYWLVLIGITGFGIVLTIVGLIQGQAWYNGETLLPHSAGNPTYYVTRLSLGALIMAGAYLGLYNVIRSLYFNRGVAS